jgi:hypothetical protein
MSGIDDKPPRNAPTAEQMIEAALTDNAAATAGSVAWFTRMVNNAERLWLFRNGEHDISYYEFALRLGYDKRNAKKLWPLGRYKDDAMEWLKTLMLKADIDTGKKPNAGAGFTAPSMAKTLRHFCPPREDDDYDDDLAAAAVKAAMLALARRPAETEQEMVSISRRELDALRAPATPDQDQELERAIDRVVPPPAEVEADLAIARRRASFRKSTAKYRAKKKNTAGAGVMH